MTWEQWEKMACVDAKCDKKSVDANRFADFMQHYDTQKKWTDEAEEEARYIWNQFDVNRDGKIDSVDFFLNGGDLDQLDDAGHPYLNKKDWIDNWFGLREHKREFKRADTNDDRILDVDEAWNHFSDSEHIADARDSGFFDDGLFNSDGTLNEKEFRKQWNDQDRDGKGVDFRDITHTVGSAMRHAAFNDDSSDDDN